MTNPSRSAPTMRDVRKDNRHGHYWPTARALRALGHPVPALVADDECVVLTVVEVRP